jgi:hypothetical protein
MLSSIQKQICTLTIFTKSYKNFCEELFLLLRAFAFNSYSCPPQVISNRLRRNRSSDSRDLLKAFPSPLGTVAVSLIDASPKIGARSRQRGLWGLNPSSLELCLKFDYPKDVHKCQIEIPISKGIIYFR